MADQSVSDDAWEDLGEDSVRNVAREKPLPVEAPTQKIEEKEVSSEIEAVAVAEANAPKEEPQEPVSVPKSTLFLAAQDAMDILPPIRKVPPKSQGVHSDPAAVPALNTSAVVPARPRAVSYRAVTTPKALHSHPWQPRLLAIYRWEAPMESGGVLLLLSLVTAVALPYALSVRTLSYLTGLIIACGGIVRVCGLSERFSTFWSRLPAVDGQTVEVIAESAGYLWENLLLIEDPTEAVGDDNNDTFVRSANATDTLEEELERKEAHALTRKLGLLLLGLLVVVQPALQWATDAAASPISHFLFLMSLFVMTRYPTRMALRHMYTTKLNPTIRQRAESMHQSGSAVGSAFQSVFLERVSSRNKGPDPWTLRWVVADLLILVCIAVVELGCKLM